MYVTQEMDEVVGADRVVALEAGTVVYAGTVAGLFGDGALVRLLGLGLPAAGDSRSSSRPPAEVRVAAAHAGRDACGPRRTS